MVIIKWFPMFLEEITNYMNNNIMIEELEEKIATMLYAFRVEYAVYRLIKSISVQCLVPLFGTLVCGLNRADYKLVDDSVKQAYPDWRVVYITTFDSMLEKKDEVLWALMRGGYMKWIRMNYPTAFTQLVVMQGFGNKIINQRLKIWDGRSKYKFLIEDNEDAKKYPATYVLATDPGFFDHMPEQGG
jgi:hypothetical protein